MLSLCSCCHNVACAVNLNADVKACHTAQTPFCQIDLRPLKSIGNCSSANTAMQPWIMKVLTRPQTAYQVQCSGNQLMLQGSNLIKEQHLLWFLSSFVTTSNPCGFNIHLKDHSTNKKKKNPPSSWIHLYGCIISFNFEVEVHPWPYGGHNPTPLLLYLSQAGIKWWVILLHSTTTN